MLSDLAGKVKDLVLSSNLDYVGVASVELLQNEPERHKPQDYLPGAQSVVVFGIKLSLGVQLSNKLAHDVGPRHLIFPYLWHGYNLPSWHFLDRTALRLTRLLEKEGNLAVPVMSASTYDIQSNLMEFSHQHAAVAAGLGDLSWSGLVLTPDAGAKARFGSVITTARLEPDPMYHGARLCTIEKCMNQGKGIPPCARICPTKALGPDTYDVLIGGKTFKVAKLDRFKCMWGSMGLTRESSGLRDIPVPEPARVEDVFNALNQRDPLQSLELMCMNGRGDYCGRCIMECPVGNSEEVEKRLRKAKGIFGIQVSERE